MTSKLILVVDAYTKLEVSSFSHSRDIGVHMLKIWASSAILNLTLSGFTQFHGFPGATEYHFRTLGPQFGKQTSELGGPSCIGSAAEESPNIALQQLQKAVGSKDKE